jgi:uncharacterized membrane protein YbhN (UPF0104 family)
MQWRRPLIVLGVLAIVSWVVLPRLLGVNPLKPLLSLRWPMVLVAAVAQVAMQLGRGLLLRGVTAGPNARLGPVRATTVVLGASSVGLLGGGFPGYAAALYRWTHASGVPPASAAMAGWIPSLLFSAAVALIAIVSSVPVLSAGFLSKGEVAGLAVGLSLVLLPMALLVWSLKDSARSERVLSALARFWARLRRKPMNRAAGLALKHRVDAAWHAVGVRAWWPLALAALFSAFCDALSVWALLAASGTRLSFAATCAAWSIPHLLGNASLLPGGAGVVELTMTPFLTRLGVNAAPALAVVLGYRALAFWVPLVAGLPLIVWFERRS